MKKVLAVLLAVLLVAGIMPTAFAVATPGLATRVIEGADFGSGTGWYGIK